MELQANVQDWPGYWAPEAPRLLALSRGKVVVLLIQLPCRRGQNPESYIMLAQEIFNRLNALKLDLTFFYGCSEPGYSQEEAIRQAFESFATFGSSQAVHISQYQSALGFVHPVQEQSPGSSGSRLGIAHNMGPSPPDNNLNQNMMLLENNPTRNALTPDNSFNMTTLPRQNNPSGNAISPENMAFSQPNNSANMATLLRENNPSSSVFSPENNAGRDTNPLESNSNMAFLPRNNSPSMAILARENNLRSNVLSPENNPRSNVLSPENNVGRDTLTPESNPSAAPLPADENRRGQILRTYEHPMFPKYHGNPQVQDNWPRDVPPEANTSLWLDGLPPTVTPHDILSQIRGAGNVKQLHINKPTTANPIHAAAKLVFFTRRAAEAVMEASQDGRVMIQSSVPRITWNRHFTAEDPADGRSRVLVITGPATLVNRRFLEAFWGSRMWWDIDEVVELPARASPPGHHTIRYLFGSWRCQADKAKRDLERSFPRVDVKYGIDPCA